MSVPSNMYIDMATASDVSEHGAGDAFVSACLHSELTPPHNTSRESCVVCGKAPDYSFEACCHTGTE